MIDVPQCLSCLHFIEASASERPLRCKAFPKGVPEDIEDNRHDHTNPFPNDNGVRFEVKE